jgi:hypothetical protein
LKEEQPSSDIDHSHQDGDANGDDNEEQNLAGCEDGRPSKKQRKDVSDEEEPQQREQEEGGGEGVEEEEDAKRCKLGTDADDDPLLKQIQHKMGSLVQCNVEREDLMKKLLLAARRSEHLGRCLKANQERSSVLLEDLDRLCTSLSIIGPHINHTVQLKLSAILMELVNGGASVGGGTGTGVAGASQAQQAQEQQHNLGDDNNNVIVQEQPHQHQQQPQQQHHHQQRRGGVVVLTDYTDATSAGNMFAQLIGDGGNQGMVGPGIMASYVQQQQCQQMLGIGSNTTNITTTTNNNNNIEDVDGVLQNNNLAADQLDPQQQQIMALLSELLSQTTLDVAAAMQLQQILNGSGGYGDGGADMNDGAKLEAANAFFSLLAGTAQQQQQQNDEKQQQ